MARYVKQGIRVLEEEEGQATLPRDPATTKAVERMTLHELLRLSSDLGNVRRFDIGAMLGALGVGLLGAAVGSGDYLFRDGPLYLLIGGLVSCFVGLLLSRERTEQVATIKRNLDFDIDSWCRENQEAKELRDRYIEAMRGRSILAWLRGVFRVR